MNVVLGVNLEQCKLMKCNLSNVCSLHCKFIIQSEQCPAKGGPAHECRAHYHGLPSIFMFGADPNLSKEPSTNSEASCQVKRPPYYPAAWTAPPPHAEPARFTMSYLTNRLRESLNLLRLTMRCLRNRLRDNLNLPGPVLLRYAETKT